MIDLHSHVLPGLDDGPRTLDASLDLLRTAAEDGISRLAATPHVRADWPTRPETMERLVAEVSAAARAAGIPVEVLPGGELDLSFLLTFADDELRRFGLGGNPALLLLEFPYAGWPTALRELVFRLALRGFRCVLAHPERNAEVQAAPERLRELVDGGVFVQLTASSVDGRGGRAARECAHALLRRGLAHLVASDAHAPSIRAVGLSAARDALADDDLARWLTEEVPRALLDGAPLPEPPAPAARRRRLPWHRGH